MIELVFRCGTRQQVDPDKTPNPVCLHCGTTKIARSVNAPKPRFTGCANGPLVNSRFLEPLAVNVAEAGPMKLKDPNAQEHRHGR